MVRLGRLTVAYISEGMKKLHAVHAARGDAAAQTVLWRGMKNLRVSDEFMRGRQGGTELAPMSTSTDLAVAARCGVSGVSGESLFLKLKVDNPLQHGADLRWLSAFPAESEVCFPPLTYLQPTGRTQDVRVGESRLHIVEVQPHLP